MVSSPNDAEMSDKTLDLNKLDAWIMHTRDMLKLLQQALRFGQVINDEITLRYTAIEFRICHNSCDVARAKLWWSDTKRLKSTETQLFVQKLNQADYKENIKISKLCVTVVSPVNFPNGRPVIHKSLFGQSYTLFYFSNAMLCPENTNSPKA